MNIPVKEIYSLMNSVFLKLGVHEEDALICSDILIASDLSGIESNVIN